MFATSVRRSLYFGAHRLFLGSLLGKVYKSYCEEDQVGTSANRISQILVSLLEHCQRNVPYYSKLMATMHGNFREAPISYLKQFPILKKDTIRENHESLVTTDLANRKWSYNSSGGSTGEPIRLIQDRQYLDHQTAIQLLSMDWAGREMGERAIFIWGSERDIIQGSMGIKRILLNRLTNEIYVNAFMMTPTKMREVLRLLNSHPPQLIIAYVQCIYELARFAEREKIRVTPQTAIMTSAGTLHDFMREKIEHVFQCKVFNRYGSREVGDIAGECTAHTGLHVFPWGNFVEIVDDDGNTIPNGTEGNILVTNLHNFAMPLIRYFIGDRGILSPSDQCTCGRRGQILEKISGRNVDLFKKKDGSLVDGEYFTHLLYYRDWVQKFQIVQKNYSTIQFKVVLNGAERPQKEELDEIIEKARLVMDQDCVILIEFLNDIMPAKSGKYRYTISEVPH